jgi:ankyrin repeat protein
MKTHQFSRVLFSPALAASLVALPLLAADPLIPSATSTAPTSAPKSPTLAPSPTATVPAPAPTPDFADLRQLLQRGLFEEEAAREYGKAAAAYSSLLSQYDTHRALAATALFRLAEIRVKQENKPDAIALFERFLREFPTHENLAPLARERLAALGKPAPATPPSSPAIDATPPPRPAPAVPDMSELERVALQRVETLARSSPDLLQAANDADSPIYQAAGKGWTHVVSFLLNNGAAADGLDGKGGPLMVAAASGHKEMVELLLQGGANLTPKPDIAATRLETTLGAACANSRLEVVKLLLARGADPNLCDRSGRSALFRACASKGARLAMATLLLEKGAKPNLAGKGPTVRDPNGSYESITPLSLAVNAGDLDLIKLLLEKGTDPNFDSGNPLQLPLCHAIIGKQLEAARLLIKGGAKTDVALPNDAFTSFPTGGSEYATTLLHSAIRYDLRIAKLFVEHGASVKQVDYRARTPLHTALLGDWQYIYPPGVNHPGDPHSNDSNNQNPPPRPAPPETIPPLREFCELLLAATHGADLRARDVLGDTPLHLAMNRPELPDDFLRWLIAKGADPFAKNNSGFTPLDVSVPARMLSLEREFLYPKIQRPDAVQVLVRIFTSRTEPPVSITGPAAKSLPALLESVFNANDLLKYNSRGNIFYPFEVFIFRPDEKKVFQQVSKTSIDLDKPLLKADSPELRLGDIVIIYKADNNGLNNGSNILARWAAESTEAPATNPPAPKPTTRPRP